MKPSTDSSQPVSLQDWLEWLEQTHPAEIELGLERVATVAARLGLAPLDVPGLDLPDACTQYSVARQIVTVAGTNGKGSAIAALEAMLLASGRRVAVYTSPHFHRYNERFRINAQELGDAEICEALSRVEQARDAVPLTYFEFSTLAALLLFARADVDVAILEVGLGGRLDAVNIVRPDVCLITRIDLDHQQWLGPDREAIGFEKAGILREGTRFVCSDREPPGSVRQRATELNTRSFYLGQDFDIEKTAAVLRWSGQNEGEIELADPGLHPDSVAAAWQIAQLVLGAGAGPALASRVGPIALQGRQQFLDYGDRRLMLDVAHNPSATVYLHQRLLREAPARCLAVFSVMADKDWAAMLDIIHDVIDHWFLAELPGNERAESATAIADHLLAEGAPTAGVHCEATVGRAIDLALQQANKNDLILVFGSFYTVAAALDHLEYE